MPEDLPDRMPEDMSDRMPEDVPVRTCINVMVGITRSKVICMLTRGYFKGTQKMTKHGSWNACFLTLLRAKPTWILVSLVSHEVSESSLVVGHLAVAKLRGWGIGTTGHTMHFHFA